MNNTNPDNAALIERIGKWDNMLKEAWKSFTFTCKEDERLATPDYAKYKSAYTAFRVAEQSLASLTELTKPTPMQADCGEVEKGSALSAADFEKWCDSNNVEGMKTPLPETYQTAYEVWQKLSATTCSEQQIERVARALYKNWAGFNRTEEWEDYSGQSLFRKEAEELLNGSQAINQDSQGAQKNTNAPQ